MWYKAVCEGILKTISLNLSSNLTQCVPLPGYNYLTRSFIMNTYQGERSHLTYGIFENKNKYKKVFFEETPWTQDVN